MDKIAWKPGNMLYPVPAVMVSCRDNEGNQNIITVAWAGTVCSDPAMVSISVRPERYSFHMLEESREFVVNLTTEALVRQADEAGVRSGREVDKWKHLQLTPQKASRISTPLIAESPVNLECRVKQVIPLGSHTMFLAEVVAVDVDPGLLEKTAGWRWSGRDWLPTRTENTMGWERCWGVTGIPSRKNEDKRRI